ncbi:MAG: enoyl-CoA hydratase [Pseudomonadota bacterium]
MFASTTQQNLFAAVFAASISAVLFASTIIPASPALFA